MWSENKRIWLSYEFIALSNSLNLSEFAEQIDNHMERIWQDAI